MVPIVTSVTSAETFLIRSCREGRVDVSGLSGVVTFDQVPGFRAQYS